MISTVIIDGRVWVQDKNDNRCSVAYWGSKGAAREALISNAGCDNCTDCFSCLDCSNCARCAWCLNCDDCTYASHRRASGQNVVWRDIKLEIPVIENIHARVYEVASHPGALNMRRWHTCQNTHCRGGWVITLAGQAGHALEATYGTALAALMIYAVSDPSYEISSLRFTYNNTAALLDMKAAAVAASAVVANNKKTTPTP